MPNNTSTSNHRQPMNTLRRSSRLGASTTTTDDATTTVVAGKGKAKEKETGKRKRAVKVEDESREEEEAGTKTRSSKRRRKSPEVENAAATRSSRATRSSDSKQAPLQSRRRPAQPSSTAAVPHPEPAVQSQPVASTSCLPEPEAAKGKEKTEEDEQDSIKDQQETTSLTDPMPSSQTRVTRSQKSKSSTTLVRVTRTNRTRPTPTVVAASSGGAPVVQGEKRVLRARKGEVQKVVKENEKKKKSLPTLSIDTNVKNDKAPRQESPLSPLSPSPPPLADDSNEQAPVGVAPPSLPEAGPGPSTLAMRSSSPEENTRSKTKTKKTRATAKVHAKPYPTRATRSSAVKTEEPTVKAKAPSATSSATPTEPSPTTPTSGTIRTRIKSIKSKGFDGNWDGRALSLQRAEKEEEDKGKAKAEPTTTDTLRRSARPRVKSAKLRMVDEEAQGAVVKAKETKAKETKVRAKKDKGKAKEVEQEAEAPKPEPAAPLVPEPVVTEQPGLRRGRSPVQEKIPPFPSSRSPSRNRSPPPPSLSRRSSASSSASSSAPPPPPAGAAVVSPHSSPLSSPQLHATTPVLRSAPLRSLDTSALERIDGLDGLGLDHVERGDTPRSFTPLPPAGPQQAAIAADTTGNTVLIDIPTVPSPLASPLPSSSTTETHHEEQVDEDMPRSAPDPMFIPISPSAEEAPPLLPTPPGSATSSPAASPPHPSETTTTTTTTHTQMPPDPLFQVSSGSEQHEASDGFSWSPPAYHQLHPADRASSPAPSTIAPDSPYLGPSGFPSDEATGNIDSQVDPAHLPPPINTTNYCILFNRLFPSPLPNPTPDSTTNPDQQQQQPSIPLSQAQRLFIYRPHPKPPCTSPPLFDLSEIARDDLSRFPPHKWLASFDDKFASMERDGGKAEHRWVPYIQCDLTSGAFASTMGMGDSAEAVSSSQGQGQGRRGRAARRPGTGRVGGREMTWGWQRMYMDFRVKKSSLRNMGREIEGMDGVLDLDEEEEYVRAAENSVGGDKPSQVEENATERRRKKKTRREEMEDENPMRRNMSFRARSETSAYYRELLESGVEGLLLKENVQWDTIRAVCEAEANEYWAKHGLPKPWRVANAGPWRKKELLHREIVFPNQTFAQLLEPQMDNPDDMDYQNEPTYLWELASDEDEDENSSDIDASSETAEEQQVEDNLLESDSEDEDEDVEADDEMGPVQGEMQLDIQAPVDQWNAPAEPFQPMSIAPASTLLSSSFQSSSSSLADALTPPPSLTPAPTPAQLMEPPRPPTPPTPGGMTYDFALSLSSRKAGGSHAANASTAVSSPIPEPTPMVGLDTDRPRPSVVGMQLPAPPLSNYFFVKRFDDSLNPLLYNPDWWPMHVAEQNKKQQQQRLQNEQATTQRETPASPIPYDFFPTSPSSSVTSVTTPVPDVTSTAPQSSPKPTSLIPPNHRQLWIRNPTRRMYHYYSERLGHIRAGTAPDPNRLRQWALWAEEIDKRNLDKRVEAAAAVVDEATKPDDQVDGDDNARARKGKAKAKTTTKGKAKGKGKAKATESELEEDAKQTLSSYDEEAATLRAVEVSIAERHGSLPRIGSSAWYEQRYQMDQVFPQGHMSDLPHWRQLARQAKAAQGAYGMYYEPSEFQQGSSRDGGLGYPTSGGSFNGEYYQQYDAANPYAAQDSHSMEFLQDNSTHVTPPNATPPASNDEMTDEDAEGDADPDVAVSPSWSFLDRFGGGTDNASTATTSASSTAADGASTGATSTSSSAIPPSVDMNIDPLLQTQPSNSQLYPSIQQPPSANTGSTLNGTDNSAQSQSQSQNRMQHVNSPNGGGDVSMYGMLNMGLSVGHQGAVNMSGINVSNLSGMGVGVMGMSVGMGIEVGFGFVGGIMGGFGMNQSVEGLDVEPWYLSNGSSSSTGMVPDGSDGQRSPPQPSVQSQPSCSRSSSPSSPMSMGMDVDPPSPGEQRLGSRSPSERESPHPLGFAMG